LTKPLDAHPASRDRYLSTEWVYGLLLACSLLLALAPALFPSLDLAVARFFAGPDVPFKPADWRWVELVNEHLPSVFRTIVILCLVGWSLASIYPRFRRAALPIAFVGLAIAMGPGLMVGAVKDYTLRARPFHVTGFGGDKQFTPALTRAHQCEDNCAFVSGHTADGFFLTTLMLLDRRRRWRWMGIGVVSGLMIGLARIAVGAHWLSDVLWAFPVTLVASGQVWLFLSRIYNTRSR
jgi:lipid A 4'-phosphatase